MSGEFKTLEIENRELKEELEGFKERALEQLVEKEKKLKSFVEEASQREEQLTSKIQLLEQLSVKNNATSTKQPILNSWTSNFDGTGGPTETQHIEQKVNLLEQELKSSEA